VPKSTQPLALRGTAKCAFAPNNIKLAILGVNDSSIEVDL